MSFKLSVLAIGMLCMFSINAFAGNDYDLTDRQGLPMPLYSARKGLPNIYKKLSTGKEVTIAYLGGSITEAARGWRDQSADKLRQKFPAAKINTINAGIGGTGSDLGVFRLRSQVLSQKPDLIFVEFAVNDIAKPASLIYKTMEGIVRQIWRESSETDICFVYTITGDMGTGLQNGKIPASTLAMEVIAEHYGIASVSMGLKVVELASQGKLVYKGTKEQYPDKIVFSGDNVHPFPETGQRLYAEALLSALDTIFNRSVFRKSKRLVKPYTRDNWEKAQMISVSEAVQDGLWEKVPANDQELLKVFKKPFTEFIKSDQPGASLSFRFRGQIAGLYDVVGPGCGQYEVTVDMQEADIVSRFDSYSTYYRPQYFLKQDLENKPHLVELKVSGKQLDKKAILLQRNSQVMDNQARYENNSCYAGYIMLVGKLLR
ncbi:SGNH/GDSL hydrolase family protein [Desertivirga xinjiangensis]|uniref:SGNH/GDSL hydrolase family protein n=1 Tax=Desertivirga xinjiangensis TaxID=539206 RepID=UPI0021089122|nr:SGNH/GDSL hydrolase family protein [Pedobacter xinjiangensis]